MNFNPTINPDNRHICICDTDCSEIVVGGTCTHVFELPFKYEEYADSCVVLYQQGLHSVLSIEVDDSMVHNNVISLTLQPEQTSQFDVNYLSAKCQLKIHTVDGDIIFDNPHMLKIVQTLDKGENNETNS